MTDNRLRMQKIAALRRRKYGMWRRKIFVWRRRLFIWRRTLGDQGGFSMVELIVALALMTALGASLLTLTGAGAEAFERVYTEKDAQSEARIALSYATVRIRQNDAAGRVSIVRSDSTSNPADLLRIDSSPENAADDALYIYYVGNGEGGDDKSPVFGSAESGSRAGALYEKYSTYPGVDNLKGANVIAYVDGFDVAYADEEKSQIKISVKYEFDGETRVAESIITLRAP